MTKSGIQGATLEVTVIACFKLDNKTWFSKQSPYVFVEYGTTKYQTKTGINDGRNPTFHEKFNFKLSGENLEELNVSVWNKHFIGDHIHIGNGRIPLEKALSEGYEESSWPIQSKNGRTSGEIRLSLRYIPRANQQQQHQANSGSSTPQPTAYPIPPPAFYPPHPSPPPATYPPQPCPYRHHPPQPSTSATPAGAYSRQPSAGFYPQVYPY